MRSWSERKVFATRARALRVAAERLVALVPEPVFGNAEWRCHELARAIGSRLGLEVVDGTFGAVDHSWLEISDGCLDRTTAILDVYAVGSLPQVRLVDRRSPEGLLFEEGRSRAEVRYEDVAALVAVFDPCRHPDGFRLEGGRPGERFCGHCGEPWSPT